MCGDFLSLLASFLLVWLQPPCMYLSFLWRCLICSLIILFNKYLSVCNELIELVLGLLRSICSLQS